MQHNAAAPFASPAWLCSTVCRFCMALQHWVQILHSRAAPLMVQCQRGAWQSPAVGLGGPSGPRCAAPPWCSPAALQWDPWPCHTFHRPGPNRCCVTACRHSAALAHPMQLQHLLRAPMVGMPRPVPEPVPMGIRFLWRPNWNGAGAMPGSARWCQGHVGGGGSGDAGERVQFLTYPTHIFF